MVGLLSKGSFSFFSRVFINLLILCDGVSVFIYNPLSSASRGLQRWSVPLSSQFLKGRLEFHLEKNAVPHINGKKNFWLLI